MSLFAELHHEQDGPSLARLHVATQTREFAPLLHSPPPKTKFWATTRVGTSMCQEKAMP
jgi:hypothetical protein